MLGEATSSLWLTIGSSLLPGQTVTIGVQRYTKSDCIAAALTLAPSDRAAWIALGSVLGANESQCVNGKQYAKIGCFATALMLNDTAVSTWLAVAGCLSPGESVDLKGQSFTRVDCLSTALKVCRSLERPNAWLRVSDAMILGEKLRLEGKDYTKADCLAAALEGEDSNPDLWLRLGATLLAGQSTVIKGKEYRTVDCFAVSLALSERNSSTWLAVAAALRPTDRFQVRGISYSKGDCLAVALRLADASEHWRIWSKMGSALLADEKVTVGGREHSKADCLALAVELGDSSPDEWLTVASALRPPETVTIKGMHYKIGDCFAVALTLPKSNPFTWFRVSSLLLPGQTVSFRGRAYSAVDCIVVALNATDKVASFWNNIGVRLLSMPGVRLVMRCNGKYNLREDLPQLTTESPTSTTDDHYLEGSDCILRALELDKSQPRLWCNVGQFVCPRVGKAVVDGVPHSQLDCYLMALKISPSDSLAWACIAESMTSEPLAVNGKMFTRIECCLRALHANPKQALAWRVLADHLPEDASVTLHGVVYVRQDCMKYCLEYRDNTNGLMDLDEETVMKICDESVERTLSVDVEVGSRSVHPDSVGSWKLGSIKGEGANGRVRRIHNRQHLVAKVMANLETQNDMVNRSAQHSDVFKDLQNHPNIVAPKKIYVDTRKGAVVHVMEEAEEGSLPEPSLDPNQPYKCFSAEECLFVARDILNALAYLHEEKCIIHGDVKPSNILCQQLEDGEYIYKLADFDGAVRFNRESEQSAEEPPMGTLPYCSPLRLNGVVKPECDLWALGISLHVLRYGSFPYPPWRTEFQLQRLITDGKVQLHAMEDEPNEIHAKLRSLIEQLLVRDSSNCVTASALLQELEEFLNLSYEEVNDGSERSLGLDDDSLLSDAE